MCGYPVAPLIGEGASVSWFGWLLGGWNLGSRVNDWAICVICPEFLACEADVMENALGEGAGPPVPLPTNLSRPLHWSLPLL